MSDQLELLTADEVMERYRVGKGTLYSLVKEGKIEDIKEGGKRLFRADQMENLGALRAAVGEPAEIRYTKEALAFARQQASDALKLVQEPFRLLMEHLQKELEASREERSRLQAKNLELVEAAQKNAVSLAVAVAEAEKVQAEQRRMDGVAEKFMEMLPNVSQNFGFNKKVTEFLKGVKGEEIGLLKEVIEPERFEKLEAAWLHVNKGSEIPTLEEKEEAE